MASSIERSQSTILDNSNKPFEQFEWSIDCLQFAISILMENYINTSSLGIYLSILTRQISVTWDYNLHCSIINLYYSLQTNIDSILIKADQPGFEGRSPGPKAVMLTIELHCIDMNLVLKFFNFWN